jgi:four helix bundle suffix protein
MLLTNVARASLRDELIEDYKSFLIQRGLPVWHKDSREALIIRERLQHDQAPNLPIEKPGRPVLTGLAGLADFVSKAEPELAANAILCAANQAAYLLKRQLESQSREFAQHGGFTERLYATRTNSRQRKTDEPAKSSDITPDCPTCNSPMRLRVANNGPNAGNQFWGCTGYPNCMGTRQLSR